MDTSKDGMIEYLCKQLAEKDVGLDAATQIINQHVADLDTLTQQLAESQARDAVRIEALEIASDFLADRMHTAPINRIDRALAMPSDSTALDEAIRQALLKAAADLIQTNQCDVNSRVTTALRRMADELKTTDVEQTNKG